MPVSVPQGLPAEEQLKKEGLLLSTEKEGRALKVLVLNLMPTKLETELQLARLLGRTPLPVKMELLGVHRMPRHTSAVHMQRFYQSFEAVEEQYYDGLILMGTPVERMPFEQVEYWPELCRILRWSITHAGQHHAYLLERTGRAVLPLRDRKAGAFAEAVRHFFTYGVCPGKSTDGRV